MTRITVKKKLNLSERIKALEAEINWLRKDIGELKEVINKAYFYYPNYPHPIGPYPPFQPSFSDCCSIKLL